MYWRERSSVLLLVAAFIVAVAGFATACTSCAVFRWSFELRCCGALLYAAGSILAFRQTFRTILRALLFLATCAHATLLTHMWLSLPVCPQCVAIGLFVFAAAFVQYPVRRELLAGLLLPVAFGSALGVLLDFAAASAYIDWKAAEYQDLLPADVVADQDASLVVYEVPNCPYCSIMRHEYAPYLERRFTARLVYVEVPPHQMKRFSVFPTAVVVRNGRSRAAVVGLGPRSAYEEALGTLR